MTLGRSDRKALDSHRQFLVCQPRTGFMDLWSETFDLDFLVRVLNFTINRPIMVTPPTTLSPSPEKLGSVGGLMIG